MKKILLIITILISSLSSQSLFQDSTDIKTDGKAVMLLFSSTRCPLCETFKKDLVENEELNALVKDMNLYEISRDNFKNYTLWGQETNLRTMEKMFAIKITPNVLIFSKDKRKIWQVPGYADASLMIPYIKFVKGLDNGTYKITQWREYLQKEGIIK